MPHPTLLAAHLCAHPCPHMPRAHPRRLPLAGCPIPYYVLMTAERLQHRDRLIPQLWSILDPRRQMMKRRSRLWDLTLPPTEAIRHILDLIGAVLVDGANTCPASNVIGGPTVELSGHMSFQAPLANEDGTPACMLVDPEKISATTGLGNKQHPYFFHGTHGYTRMTLAAEYSTAETKWGKVVPVRKDIIESVHRFVLWAMHGPPGEDMMRRHPVCMHACHNEACVSPYHVQHGTCAENLRDRKKKKVQT